MSATVDALLPLSFLEAVRNVDSPVEDFEAELVGELRNKRLGLSDTVYNQIRRFNDAVKRNQRASLDEAIALARLLGRRPDAEAVFRAAGRHLAVESYRTVGLASQRLMLTLPSLLSRPIALRSMRRISRRYLNGRISRVGAHVFLEVGDSVTCEAAPRSIGCTYYESALKELLRLTVNGGGAVEHVRCRSRGEGVCQWRAEWKPMTHTAD
jgi:predicted hydrocarbon binding protein